MPRLTSHRPRASLLILTCVSTLAACTPGGSNDAGPREDGGGDGDAGADTCVLTAQERALVEEVTLEALQDAYLVGSHADVQEAAYALSLVGADVGQAGFAFLIAPCTEPSSFVPYCEGGGGGSPGEEPGGGDLRPGQSVCTQFVCEAAGITVNHVWFAEEGHEALDDEHAFALDTSSPAGEAVYDPRPRRSWRADLTEPGRAVVEADLDHHVVITPAAPTGAPIDVSHTGTVTAVRDEMDPDPTVVITLSLTFTALFNDPIEVSASVDAEAIATGRVHAGDDEVATLTGGFATGFPTLEWTSAPCP